MKEWEAQSSTWGPELSQGGSWPKGDVRRAQPLLFQALLWCLRGAAHSVSVTQQTFMVACLFSPGSESFLVGGGCRGVLALEATNSCHSVHRGTVSEATAQGQDLPHCCRQNPLTKLWPWGKNRCSSWKRWPCFHLALSFVASLQRMRRTTPSVGYLSHSCNASTSLPTQGSKLFCKRLRAMLF